MIPLCPTCLILFANGSSASQGGAVTLSSGDNWEDDPGPTIIIRNSTFTGNFAELDSAGAIYVGEYATVKIEGQRNNFTANVCGFTGGVLAATSNTNVTVEGGLFQENEADEVCYHVGKIISHILRLNNTVEL